MNEKINYNLRELSSNNFEEVKEINEIKEVKEFEPCNKCRERMNNFADFKEVKQITELSEIAELAIIPEVYANAQQNNNKFCGMCYVPVQQWEQVYDEDTAFHTGTIFPCLNKPFLGAGR